MKEKKSECSKKKYSTISKVWIQAGLTHASRQTVYNCIKKTPKFLFSRRDNIQVGKITCSLA